MTDRLYLDIHILQTVPPANLNRDEAGSPKQALYGGVRRARVSSQAWKRATRVAFTEHVPRENLATRTKKVSGLLAERLIARFGLPAEQAARLATSLLAPLKIKPAQKKAEETAYLLFFGRHQLDRIADLIAGTVTELVAMPDEDQAEAVKDLPVTQELRQGHPLDVALFGRMVADLAALNVDASAQVAHALSTHPVEIEFDYYTAVDDENPREETGAGMIGTVEYNSATLYRYSTLGVHQLRANLGDDQKATAEAVRLFLECFVRSMPTGHQNTFAHRTLPQLVMVALRRDQPVNLVSAFERPVLSGVNGIAEESAVRLAEEFTIVSDTWGTAPELTVATYAGGDTVAAKLTDAFGRAVAFPELVKRVNDATAAWLAQSGAR